MVVLEILMLLLSSAACVDVDLTGFSARLLQLTDTQLGIKQFQAMIDDQKQTQFSFLQWIPNGEALAEQISRDIDDKVNDYMDAVRRIRNAYNGGQINVEIRLPLCCTSELKDLVYDQSFMRAINVNMMCHLTKSDMSVDDAVKVAMVGNLQRIPSIIWQFYGTEDRRHCTYPARSACDQSNIFDSRVRPWYTTTLNNPRDIVILIDRSTSMGDQYSPGISATKFSVAKGAASALVQYLNANDRVAVLAFSDTILSLNSTGCFSVELAVATDDNKNQLLGFVNGLSFNARGTRAMFEVAFRSAKQLFDTTENKTTSGLYAGSDKIIVLLTDANQIENCQQIRQLEADLFNDTVNIFTMGVGESTQSDPQKIFCLKNLTAGPRGAQGYVPYSSDFSDLRSQLGFYYNAFIDRIDRNRVVFSPPFTDVSGLGLQSAACLPLFFSNNSVSGVTCVEFGVFDIFREIVNFRLGQLSYGFVIDSKGRVILHRLLPQPTYWLDQPTLLELTMVEISDYALEIEKLILSGQPGNKTVSNVRYYIAAGQSDLDGVTKFDTTATYYWHNISSMNFSLGLVIIQNELSSNVTWKGSLNDVFLSDEMDVTTGSDGNCVFFNRSSLTDRSVVKLAPKAFLYPANYTQRSISQSDLNLLKSYITVKGGQSPNLTIQDGIRDVVAATSPLEAIWLQNTSDVQNILSRYIGTKEGVFRRFPAVRIDKNFDPTIQPWYQTASVQPNQISFTMPFLDYASSVPTISMSKIVWNRRGLSPAANDTIMGVIGMDVTVKYLCDILVDTIDQCSQNGQECFAIDASGFIIIHKDFRTVLPTGSLHIAAREQAVATDLSEGGFLMADACINYVSLPITKRLFWKTAVSSCQQRPTCIICQLKFSANVTNLFLVVKLPAASSSPNNCACLNQTDGKYRCTYDLAPDRNQCQCPCNLSVAYDTCLSDLQIDPVTWKPCIPSATLLNQADVTSQINLSNLPSCLRCSSFTDPQVCQVNNCYWLDDSATCSSTPASTAITTIATGSTTPTTALIRSFSSYPASPVSSSNHATTLGLAIGLSLSLFLLLAALVVGFFIWRSWNKNSSKLGRSRVPYDTPNPLYESIDDGKVSTGSPGSQTGSRTIQTSLSTSSTGSPPHVTHIKVGNDKISTSTSPPTPDIISSQYLDTGADQACHSLSPRKYSTTC